MPRLGHSGIYHGVFRAPSHLPGLLRWRRSLLSHIIGNGASERIARVCFGIGRRSLPRRLPKALNSRRRDRHMTDVKFATLSGDYTAVSQASVDDFRGGLNGVSLLPGDDGYDGVRRVWNAMVDKRPALIARVQRDGRRDQLGQLCPRERPADLGARRRPQLPGQQRLRGRVDDRPFPDDRCPRGSGDQNGPRPGRNQMGSLRPRDPGLRARRAGWNRSRHRHRRPHAGRRHRMAVGQPTASVATT